MIAGDRHYAKSETLDNLPLTDPENFGTPVLANKKNRSRRRPQQEEGELALTFQFTYLIW